jgi:hypothetical protein
VTGPKSFTTVDIYDTLCVPGVTDTHKNRNAALLISLPCKSLLNLSLSAILTSYMQGTEIGRDMQYLSSCYARVEVIDTDDQSR